VATVCSEPKRCFDKQILVLCGDYPYKTQVTTATFPSYGLYDKLAVICKLKEPENYNDFKYKKYLNKQGIYFICYSWSAKKIEAVDYSNLDLLEKIKYKLWLFKMSLAQKIERNLAEPGAGLSKAMFLGLKTEIEPKLKESLEDNGLAHILAISGMHIAIIYALIIFLLKRLRANKIFIKIIIVLILFMYLAMINFSVSASRAVIMIIISFSASTLKKSLNRLYLTAFIMLLISPGLISSAAMQMSFLAVWSLLTIMPVLDYYVLKKISRIRMSLKAGNYRGFKLAVFKYIIKVFNNRYFKYLYFLFLASLAVNIMLWPLFLYYFDVYNLLSILINLFIVPLVPLILALIILGLSFSFIPFLSKIFFLALYFVFEYFYSVASLDFSSFYISLDISMYFLFLYYLSISLYFHITKNRLRKNLLFVKNI
jgi:competence protein ComEC